MLTEPISADWLAPINSAPPIVMTLIHLCTTAPGAEVDASAIHGILIGGCGCMATSPSYSLERMNLVSMVVQTGGGAV